MDKIELQKRTKKFSVRVYFLVNKFSNSIGAKAVGTQVIRSSASVAANYRAACRAKSKADFINKLKIVEEEADESLFWLEYIEEVGLATDKNELENLNRYSDFLTHRLLINFYNFTRE